MMWKGRSEEDYLPGPVKSSGCQENGACTLGGSGKTSIPASRREGPIAFLYPAAAIVAAILLIIMAAV